MNKTELKTAKELWTEGEGLTVEEYIVMNRTEIIQHLQTCERWLEFLDKIDLTVILLYQSKKKDLKQAIKYHKSKLGEQEK